MDIHNRLRGERPPAFPTTLGENGIPLIERIRPQLMQLRRAPTGQHPLIKIWR